MLKPRIVPVAKRAAARIVGMCVFPCEWAFPFRTAAHPGSMMAHNFAAFTSVDHPLGTLLDELERTGQADNTIMVLMGDHVYTLGEWENLSGRGVMWDRALQTPLRIRAPWASSVPVVETPVGRRDAYPGLVELAGLPQPATPLDDRTLVGLVRGTTTAAPDRTLRCVCLRSGPLARCSSEGSGSTKPCDWAGFGHCKSRCA